MNRYINARIVWLYIIHSNAKGWGVAYDVASKEYQEAFTALLYSAYPSVKWSSIL